MAKPKTNVRFSELSPEEQDKAYEKIRCDRDLFAETARSCLKRLKILSEKCAVVGKKLVVFDRELTDDEIKVLADCLEVLRD